jgi:hypothetical protein
VHKYLKNIELQLIIMGQIRHDGKQKKDKGKQCKDEVPGNCTCRPANVVLEDPLNIDIKHFPQGYAKKRNMNTIQELMDFSDKPRGS